MSDLEAKDAIQQVYVRYCEIVDSKQFEHMVEVFTPDTVGDYTQAYGPGVVMNGVQVTISLMQRNLGELSNCGPTHHNVGNFRIRVHGNTATARVNFYAVHRGIRDYPGARYSMWGEYDDDLVLTLAGWRVKNRRYSISLREGPNVCSAPGDTPS